MGIEAGMAIMAALSAISTGYSVYSGERGSREQADARREAKKSAEKQEGLQEEANNRANSNQPDTSAILAAAQQAAKAGVSGTMLTGPEGVDQSQLTLGKKTLLGG